jgi:hypothetical protein
MGEPQGKEFTNQAHRMTLDEAQALVIKDIVDIDERMRDQVKTELIERLVDFQQWYLVTKLDALPLTFREAAQQYVEGMIEHEDNDPIGRLLYPILPE